MKATEVNILIIPDFFFKESNEIWHERWEKKLSTAKTISSQKHKLTKENFNQWVEEIEFVIQKISKEKNPKPIIFIAHGLGVLASMIAAHEKRNILGGFFVTPTSENIYNFQYPENLLYQTTIILSENDPESNIFKIKKLSQNWEASLVNARKSGHIDKISGHGPWPEGLLVFIKFLSSLKKNE